MIRNQTHNARFAQPFRLSLVAVFAFGATLALAGCDKDKNESANNNAPPTPPPPSASAQAANVCASGGGEVKDPQSAAFFPRLAGGFCIDPAGTEKTYGEGGKFSMDEVCTTAFDGECEVYKHFGLKRVVSLRYVDGAGKPSSVEVNLSMFNDPAGAYAMFTKRVVADGDPMHESVHPINAGGAAAIGSTNGYVWKGQYLAELTFVSEDPNATKESLTRASAMVTGAIVHQIGAKLPGTNEQLASVKALPMPGRIPLGVEFFPKDALGFTGIGDTAIGYYREGEQRYELVSMARKDTEQAKETFKSIKSKAGTIPVKDVGDEAVMISIQEEKDKPKVDYLFSRKGSLVAGVGDDRFGGAKLSKDDKVTKLKAWLAQPATGGTIVPTAGDAGIKLVTPPAGTAATKK